MHVRKEPYDVYIGRLSIWGQSIQPQKRNFRQMQSGNQETSRAEVQGISEIESSPSVATARTQRKTSRVLVQAGICHGDAIIEVMKEIFGEDV